MPENEYYDVGYGIDQMLWLVDPLLVKIGGFLCPQFIKEPFCDISDKLTYNKAEMLE